MTGNGAGMNGNIGATCSPIICRRFDAALPTFSVHSLCIEPFCHSERSRGISDYFGWTVARDVSTSLDMTKRLQNNLYEKNRHLIRSGKLVSVGVHRPGESENGR